MKILVIDDSPLHRAVLKWALTNGKNKVVTAENGQKGLEAFSQEDFGMVIVDRIMPDMRGEEVVKKIRLTSKTGQLIIIFTSLFGRGEQEIIAPVAKAAGADFVFDKGELESKIKDVFDSIATRQS